MIQNRIFVITKKQQKILIVLCGIVLVCSLALILKTPSTPTPSSNDDFSPAPVEKIEPEAQAMLVHIGGAVKHPGVYTVSSNARVVDVVKAAGGLLGYARGDSVALAAHLKDGDHIVIPAKESAVDLNTPLQTRHYRPSRRSKSRRKLYSAQAHSDATAALVSLNLADVTALQRVPGISLGLAQRIVAERDKSGGFFRSIDDLGRVKGIGPKTLDRIRPFLSL